jgi:hypothetical protein
VSHAFIDKVSATYRVGTYQVRCKQEGDNVIKNAKILSQSCWQQDLCSEDEESDVDQKQDFSGTLYPDREQ